MSLAPGDERCQKAPFGLFSVASLGKCAPQQESKTFLTLGFPNARLATIKLEKFRANTG
jgi:hypothetical protein